MRGGLLLLVATDRISAYDHVLPTPIPDKGKILTQLSLWWFDQLADLVPNHLVDAPVPAEFAGRAMVCQQLSMIGVECVARGYLAGSGWHDYQRTQAVCGTALPPGLVEGGQLPGGPIFTPATKAPRGEHDENIPVASVAGLVGAEVAAELERITLEVYRRGAEVAARRRHHRRGHQDRTGRRRGRAAAARRRGAHPGLLPVLASGQWRPGRPQPSFDKQYVRDWLDSPESGWDRHRPGAEPPELPERVVERTRALYIEAYERITGLRWG